MTERRSPSRRWRAFLPAFVLAGTFAVCAAWMPSCLQLTGSTAQAQELRPSSSASKVPQASHERSLFDLYASELEAGGGQLTFDEAALWRMRIAWLEDVMSRDGLRAWEVCRYGGERMAEPAFEASLRPIIESIDGPDGMLALALAAARYREMEEAEQLVRRHPAFTSMERERLLRRSQADKRRNLLGVLMCLVFEGKAEFDPQVKAFFVGTMNSHRMALDDRIKRDIDLTNRLFQIQSSIYLSAILGADDLDKFAGERVGFGAEWMAGVIAAIAPGSHPMLLNSSSAFMAFVSKYAALVDQAKILAAKYATQARDPNLRIVMNGGADMLGLLRADWVRTAGGPHLFGIEVARQLINDFTESMAWQGLLSREQAARQRNMVRLFESAIDAAVAGRVEEAKLYAAAPGGYDKYWHLGGWADWEWLSSSDMVRLTSQGRIVKSNGRLWLLPPGRAESSGVLPTDSQEVLLAFDPSALARGDTPGSHETSSSNANTLYDPWVSGLLGDVLSRDQKTAPYAAEHLERAVRLLPDEPLLFEALGATYRWQHRHADAIAAYGKAQRLEDRENDDLAVGYAHSLAVVGRHAAALAVLDGQLRKKSDSPKSKGFRTAFAFAADLRSMQLSIEELTSTHDILMDLAEESDMAGARYGGLFNRAAALAVVKRMAASGRFQQTAVEQSARSLMGQIVDDYRSLRLKPSLPEAARRLAAEADSLVRGQSLMPAILAYGRALEVAPWWPEGYRNMALTYGAMGAEERAVDTMEIFLALEPEHPLASQARSSIVLWKDRANKVRAKGGNYRDDIPFPIFPDKE